MSGYAQSSRTHRSSGAYDVWAGILRLSSLNASASWSACEASCGLARPSSLCENRSIRVFGGYRLHENAAYYSGRLVTSAQPPWSLNAQQALVAHFAARQ